MRVILLYHFFHPDDVISARMYSDLAAGLAERGWDVEAWPANRTWSGDEKLSAAARWHGVTVRRIRRPAWSQASNRGRLMNAAWMLLAWTWACLWRRRPGREIMIVGSDPVLGALVVLPWRLFRPKADAAHWCFDLYPDAAEVDGVLRPRSSISRLIRRAMGAAYRRCALVADLGPCMAERLRDAFPALQTTTITPWALVEPESPAEADPNARRELFGDAELGVLYSGSFGRAHSYREFLDLARRLRQDSVAFCFAGRGHCMDELRAAVGPDDTNIRFAGFAPEQELERRLAACDLHLVSLRQEWTGTVVPSKFFGALAAGRGVIFAGSDESSIAQWIREFQVGWVLLPETGEDVAAELRELVRSPERIRALRAHCHAVYQERFSKERMLAKWDGLLRQLVGQEPREIKTHQLSESGGVHSGAN